MQKCPFPEAYEACEKGLMVWAKESIVNSSRAHESLVIGLHHCPGNRYTGDNEGYREHYYACYQVGNIDKHRFDYGAEPCG